VRFDTLDTRLFFPLYNFHHIQPPSYAGVLLDDISNPTSPHILFQNIWDRIHMKKFEISDSPDPIYSRCSSKNIRWQRYTLAGRTAEVSALRKQVFFTLYSFLSFQHPPYASIPPDDISNPTCPYFFISESQYYSTLKILNIRFSPTSLQPMLRQEYQMARSYPCRFFQ
jgi:hypothetical protein